MASLVSWIGVFVTDSIFARDDLHIVGSPRAILDFIKVAKKVFTRLEVRALSGRYYHDGLFLLNILPKQNRAKSDNLRVSVLLSSVGEISRC